jgi:chromate transporter
MILSWLQLYLVFLKIGFFSFGGGYVMLPLIHQQIELHHLLPIEEFPDLVALSQMTPGPIAINAATYIGFRNAGLFGALFATLGVITPSLILVLIILRLLHRFSDNLLSMAVLRGVKPVTVGMIAVASVYFLERTILRGSFWSLDFWEMNIRFLNYPALILFALVIIGVVKSKISPLILTLLSGVAALFLL